MTRMRAFVENAWIAYRALFRYWTPSAYVATKVLFPVEVLFLFTYLGLYVGGPERIAFYLIGNAIVVVAINGINGVASMIGEERGLGTLPFLIASPVSRMAILLERALFNILDGIASVLIALLVGWALFGLEFSRTNFFALTAALLVASYATACLGMLIGVLALPLRDVVALMGAGMYVLITLSGVNIPISQLPAWLQPVSFILPLTRGVAAARAAMDGASLLTVGPALLAEITVGTVYWMLASALVAAMERAALRRGEMENV